MLVTDQLNFTEIIATPIKRRHDRILRCDRQNLTTPNRNTGTHTHNIEFTTLQPNGTYSADFRLTTDRITHSHIPVKDCVLVEVAFGGYLRVAEMSW